MCAAIAHLQPENAIIVDESLTSGGAYWELSKVRPFSCTPVLARVGIMHNLLCPSKLHPRTQLGFGVLLSHRHALHTAQQELCW